MTITVFDKPDCPQCAATIRRLDKRGIPYTVQSALDHLDEIKAAGFSAAPVIAVDGVLAWSGFRPDKIDALLTS